MFFDVLTLFPGMFASPFADSIMGKAVKRGLVQITAHHLRDWAEGKHQITDDVPYGGGEGMVLKPEPVARALRDLRQRRPHSRVLLMTPQGKPFCQESARQLAGEESLVFVCGRYEGFDERIRSMVDDEFSLGDFVLTGGELAAMTIIDAVGRLVPGVLGNRDSAASDSYSDGLLEYAQYTRPAEFEGMKVPDVLLSGNHAAIARWRRQQQLLRTWLRRPDLLERACLSDEDRRMLQELQRQADSGEQ
ncbi:tRNA (N1-methyl-G37)-methyltransferase [Syntrophotalea carbinolica DSM 2380]|uniref:tRNA (guanine-N(1)-)-methyltransferase n=1 Tax=Syntrophotalea carbinolica (strain DSM 2380 / NBRC 103641 / GraBd1) TaxID=338963 RepID=TRMD_SYNC1|nr:tRNA (guanosine(37)-N1)-methyltransferase TrmD [Syntrophotalea carbinolica]Q3A2E7.1 RecName: Full=tRNA (guanine-N(1)-)-methyltransferase; AltName: Full=M1G-methyltransferase; AltName: Full=tRNA [GM37] methyltransferase [Syntrophotalea carbinolica DSM 2380]ABA89460.1 tRNA (N1-methyl-G37)-methyltransferase [Syntrophotalea carbinolica DSM 2380]